MWSYELKLESGEMTKYSNFLCSLSAKSVNWTNKFDQSRLSRMNYQVVRHCSWEGYNTYLVSLFYCLFSFFLYLFHRLWNITGIQCEKTRSQMIKFMDMRPLLNYVLNKIVCRLKALPPFLENLYMKKFKTEIENELQDFRRI